MEEAAATPPSDRCSNGTQITAEFNATAFFGVPSVAFNETSVQTPESGSTSAATQSASATASGTSDANQLGGKSILAITAAIISLVLTHISS